MKSLSALAARLPKIADGEHWEKVVEQLLLEMAREIDANRAPQAGGLIQPNRIDGEKAA